MVLRFRYPLEPAPRIAVVGLPALSGTADIVLADTVAAPAAWFRDCPVRGWQPTYPVIAFSSLACGFLSEQDRDDIWRRWGVPVFEQLLSDRLEVIAEECEAHDGLHLVRGMCDVAGREVIVAGVPSGVLADVEHRSCECLNTSPRLMNVAVRTAAEAVGA